MAERLGTILIEAGLITNEQLGEALAVHDVGSATFNIPPGERLGKILLMMGILKARDLALVLCKQQSKADYIFVEDFPVDPVLANRLGRENAEQYQALPMVRLGRGPILFLTRTPLPKPTREGLARVIGAEADDLPDPDAPVTSLIQECFNAIQKRSSLAVHLGEVLVREGLLTKPQLDTAMRTSEREGQRLSEYLVRRRLVEDYELFRLMAQLHSMEFLSGDDLARRKIDYALARKTKREYVRYNHIIPIEQRDRTLVAATIDPSIETEELLAVYECDRLERVIVTRQSFAQLFQRTYGEPFEAVDPDAGEESSVLEAAPEEQSEGLEDVGAIRDRYEQTVQRLLARGIEMRASDIHIENFEDRIQVRMRIDGILHNVRDLGIDKLNIAGVTNVLKIEGDLNITENRAPQGGAFRKRDRDGRTFDFRIQVTPTVHGESTVIRILPARKRIPELDEIGMPSQVLEAYRRACANPSGLILVTGPTGSGKTTTLSSTLARLAEDPTRKVLTIEDPVEYTLPNVLQSEVIPAKNYQFAEAARAFMRMDPDVILIGEIRDSETAREAVRLSYSGHLIFATLHTSDTITTVERMQGFEVEKQVLLDQLLAISNQRLVRRLCPFCRCPFEPKPADLRDALPQGIPKGLRFYTSDGCDRCTNLGHSGRELLTEFLTFNGETRHIFRQESERGRIYVMLHGKSLESIVDDAVRKVDKGLVDVRWLPEIISQDRLELGPSDHLRLGEDAEES